MNFILFIMFFITPPNDIERAVKNTKDDHRVWTLQSTTSMDFNTYEQCEAAKKTIRPTIEQTNTLKIRAWCMGKGALPSAALSTLNQNGAVTESMPNNKTLSVPLPAPVPRINEINPLPDSP